MFSPKGYLLTYKFNKKTLIVSISILVIIILIELPAGSCYSCYLQTLPNPNDNNMFGLLI